MKPRILVGLVLAVALMMFGLPGVPDGSIRRAEATAAGVAYTYDALGRLKTVTDPVGARATYDYDAVGNLLSIVRSTVPPGVAGAAQALVAEKKPTIGQLDRSQAKVADQLTITGTGFSPEPLDNTVRIGGVVATVVSASATKLGVRVPPGTAGGEVRVTTPRGDVVRDKAITVTPSADDAPLEAAKPKIQGPLPDGPQGTTALAGQVVNIDGSPRSGVTLSIGKAQAVSDASGLFLLKTGVAGHQKLIIDGATVPGPVRYGVYEAGVDLASGKTTKLTWAIWMPVQDDTYAVTFPSPTTQDVVVTNPGLPGAQIVVRAGTKIIDRAGKPVTKLTLTPIPLDRTPIPLAPGMPVYFDLQPGGATVQGPGLQVVYPNNTNHVPGTRLDFVTHDPDARGMGWRAYGHGVVTTNGKIVPDEHTVVYRTSGFSVIYNPLCQDKCPQGGPEDGDPVNLGTGLFVMDKTDLILPDVIPVALQRTYRQNHYVLQSFGIGQTQGLDMFIAPDSVGNYVLSLPDGGKVPFSPGVDGVYRALSSPNQFYGAVLARPGSYDFRIDSRDGSVLTFGGKTASLIGVADRFGNKLTVIRNASGQIQRATGPNGRWLSFTWGPCSGASICITKAADNMGRTTSYAYDSSGRLVGVTDAANKTTTYAWAACGAGNACTQLVSITDPLGNTWLTNQFDSNGRVTQQTQADGTAYGFAYTLDGVGKVTRTTITDPRGIVRAVDFGGAGYSSSDTLAVGRPEQQVSTVTRDTSNLVTSVVDALNRSTTFTYDSVGNVKSVTRLPGTSLEASTKFTYEPAFNRIATVTDPMNHITTYTYNDQAKTVTVKNPLGAATVITLLEGQPVTVKDPLGNRTDFSYLEGDLVAVADPLGRVTTRYLDAGGRLRRVTDPLGNYTQHSYDALNEVVSSIDPLGGVTSFTYDANGNMLTLRDPRLQVTSYAYNAMGRTTSRTDPLGRAQTFGYDGNGHLITSTDRRGTVNRLAYDALGRQTLAAYGWTATESESTVTTTYDAGNHLTSAVDSLAGTTNRAYDLLGRLTSETGPQGSVAYTYDNADRRTTMTVGGQTPVGYAFDNSDRLTSITQGSAVASYAYDTADRQTSLTLPNGLVQRYAYDTASQLSSITYVSGTTNIGDLTYAYDGAGRRSGGGGSYARTGLPIAVASATYNANNELQTFGGQAFTYDNEGELRTDGTSTNTWNARGELTSITGGTSANFVYDSFGRRLRKTLGGTTTSFLYDGATIVQELSGATPTANLLTGRGIDQTLTRTDSAGTRQILTEALGSTIALTDNVRSITTTYTYEPFGKSTTSGASDGNPYQYTGRENDGSAGYYYRARYYNPGVQRFLSQDPMGFGGGDTNLSTYVANSPTNLVDPSGQIFGPGAVLGGVVGGIAGMVTNAAGYGIGAAATGNWSWREFGGAAAGGFVGGAVTGACIGSGVGLLIAAGCGAAGGLAGRVVDNVFSGRKNPFEGALCSAGVGAVMGGLNNRVVPMRGFPPTKISNVWNPGINASRMYADTATIGLWGGITSLNC